MKVEISQSKSQIQDLSGSLYLKARYVVLEMEIWPPTEDQDIIEVEIHNEQEHSGSQEDTSLASNEEFIPEMLN